MNLMRGRKPHGDRRTTMLKSSMMLSLAHRSTSGTRSPGEHAVTCTPTNHASYAGTLLAPRTSHLALVPLTHAPIVRTAQPSVDAPRTPGERVAYPHAGLLHRLLTLLATEPEPDKLPAYLMRELAEQLGADGVYLFRTDAAMQTLALAPWMIVDGAIRHCATMPTLMPLTGTCAITLPPTLQVERYTLRHDRHPHLESTSITRFRQQGYRVGLTLPLLAGGLLLGFLECMAKADTAFLPSQIEQARALVEQISLALQCARLSERAA